MATVNSGLHLRLLPLTKIDFSNTILANSAVQTITIAQHIEAHSFTIADLVVRTHAGTSIGAGASLKVNLVADGYDFEDPASQFLSSTNAAQIVLGPSLSGASYNIQSGSAQMGRHLAVQLVATQPAAAVALVVFISIDLTLKGGDPSGLMNGPNSFRGYRIQ